MGYLLGNAIGFVWSGDMYAARVLMQRAIDSGNIHGTGSHYAEHAIAKVMACEPSALTRVLRALVGGPTDFHAVTPRSVGNAIVVLDAEIARMESEAA